MASPNINVSHSPTIGVSPTAAPLLCVVSPSGNQVWTAAEFAAIVPVAGSFYLVGA